MVTIKSEKANSLMDGQHVGKVTKITMRTVPVNGQDVSFLDLELTAEDIMVKCGLGAKLNPNSELGKLLVRFGYDSRTFGQGEVDIDKILMGKTVQFKTQTEESKKNGKFYSNVVSASVNPITG